MDLDMDVDAAVSLLNPLFLEPNTTPAARLAECKLQLAFWLNAPTFCRSAAFAASAAAYFAAACRFHSESSIVHATPATTWWYRPPPTASLSSLDPSTPPRAFMIDTRADFFEAAFCDCRRSVWLDHRMPELPVLLSSPSICSSCTRLPCRGQDVHFYQQGH